MSSTTKFLPTIYSAHSVENLFNIRFNIEHHKVIVIRLKNRPDPFHLKLLARRFGKVLRNHDDRFFVDDEGEILRVSNEKDDHGKPAGLFGSNELNWHCDYAHTPGDYHGTLLFNSENGESEPTVFSDTVSTLYSYEEKYGTVEPRIGYHNISYNAFVGEKTEAELRLLRMRGYVIDDANYMQCCIHEKDTERDLVMKHPITGERSLYLSPATIQHFEPELIPSEYTKMVEELGNHEYVHEWEPNDIVVFDNLTTIHRREKLMKNTNRVLYRMQFDYIGN